jgi:hypothetical protein
MKRFFLVAAATLALCAPALAQSNYPSMPVKLIVDSAPGISGWPIYANTSLPEQVCIRRLYSDNEPPSCRSEVPVPK